MLPKIQLIILELLEEHGEQKGFQLVALSKGRLSRSTVYFHLHILVDQGFVNCDVRVDQKIKEMAEDNGYKPLNDGKAYYYSITDGGVRAKSEDELNKLDQNLIGI